MEKEFYILSSDYSIIDRQTKKGKAYDVRFRVINKDGETKQKRLSNYATKTLAKKAYMDFVTEHCETVKANPFKRKDAKKEKILLSELAVQYFNAIRNQIKDATIYEQQKIFDLWILPTFGNCKISDIKKENLLNWQDDIWSKTNPKTGEYYAYKYLSKIRSYFSAFLTWCQDRYPDSVHNWLLEIRKPKRRAPQKTMEFWTREEFDKFIAVVDDPLYHAIFMTFFFTGRRKGEILALSPKDINLKKGCIYFSKSITRKTLDDSPYKITSTKTELISATYICKPLLEELSHYEPEENAVFYFGGDTPITDNTLRRVFNTYAEKAGVKQIRIHDLRHSFVSMCIHLGATLPAVADLIGDTLAQVTKTYAHLYEDDKRRIIDSIT